MTCMMSIKQTRFTTPGDKHDIIGDKYSMSLYKAAVIYSTHDFVCATPFTSQMLVMTDITYMHNSCAVHPSCENMTDVIAAAPAKLG